MISDRYDISLIKDDAHIAADAAKAIFDVSLMDGKISRRYLREKARTIKSAAEFLLSMAETKEERDGNGDD